MKLIHKGTLYLLFIIIFVIFSTQAYSQLSSKDDYVYVINGGIVEIDVLANDNLPGECINILPEIVSPPSNGSYTLGVDNKLRYTPNDGYVGNDVIEYRIKCVEEFTAKVHIIVHEKPDNIIDADCFIPPPVQEWGIDYKKTENVKLSPFQNAVVGDIDGDGIVEILVCQDPENNSPWQNRSSTKIAVYKGNNIDAGIHHTITTEPYSWDTYTKYAIVKTKINNHDSVIIVVAARDMYLYAYNYNGTLIWKSSEIYHSSDPANYQNLVTASFADLDGDGIPEIMAGSKIFNSVTGKLMCKVADLTGNVTGVSIPIAADLYNTGKQNVILGSRIYETNNGLSQLTLVKSFAPVFNTVDPDYPGTQPYVSRGGRVSVVDMDLDGKPDLVITVAAGAYTDAAYTFVYIADPETGLIKASKYIPIAGVSSYPFVGDIDGDGYPEIVFIKNKENAVISPDRRFMYAYKYVPGNPILQEFWRLTHEDTSGATAMTLFDFNNDGISEIVYRDEKLLRIINGSGKSHTTGNDTIIYNLAEYKCHSGTSAEYPVVADVDGDGQAEILIVGNTTSATYTGDLWVFKSHDPVNYPWAPARRVWNQYAYNPANINEDLTVPKKPLNTFHIFPGNDGVLGTSDDVRPYNNFLQQQTLLNWSGTPFFVSPNVVLGTPAPEITYLPNGSVKINLVVKNSGTAILPAPIHVSIYKNTVTVANVMETVSITTDISINGSVPIEITIPNVDTAHPDLKKVVIRLNDKGDAQYNQMECNYTDNTYISSQFLLLTNDLATTELNKPVDIDVLANDSHKGCTRGNLANIKVSTTNGPTLGSAEFIKSANDTILRYTPTNDMYGIDSMLYIVKDCKGAEDSATVYVAILKPYSMRYVACPGAGINLGFEKITDVKYYWYTVKTGGQPIKSDAHEMYIIKDNSAVQKWYVEARYKDMVFPRDSIYIDKSDNCGNEPANGCIIDGTLLFKEDFGGNDLISPRISGSQLGASITSYPFLNQNINTTLTSSPSYSILKYNINKLGTFTENVWHTGFSDYTKQNDTTQGYFMMVEATDDISDIVYSHRLDNLCEGSTLSFSARAINMIISGIATNGYDPVLKFEITDVNDNNIFAYHTSNLLRDDENSLKWRLYGFSFEVPQGYSSLNFKIRNDSRKGYEGNDFAIDDIEIRLCVDKVGIDVIDADTTVCKNSNLTLVGNYTDNGYFTAANSNLFYHWEYNKTGNLNVEADWEKVSGPRFSGTEGSVSGTILSSSLHIAGIQPDDAAFYRLVVANQSLIDNINCRAMSDPIQVKLLSFPSIYPDIRIQACSNIGEINLSKYLDTAGFEWVKWTKSSPFIPAIDNNKGIINSSELIFPNTYIYNYQIKNRCYISEGKSYVRTIAESPVGLPPASIKVCWENAEALHLNQILGLEAKGEFVPVEVVAGDVARFVSIAAPNSLHEGATIFNGKKAYSELGSAYNHGSPNIKKVSFKYKITDPASCLYQTGGTEYTIDIVLTNSVL